MLVPMVADSDRGGADELRSARNGQSPDGALIRPGRGDVLAGSRPMILEIAS